MSSNAARRAMSLGDDLGLLEELPKYVCRDNQWNVAMNSSVQVRQVLHVRTYRYAATKELGDQFPVVNTGQPFVNKMTAQKQRASGVETTM